MTGQNTLLRAAIPARPVPDAWTRRTDKSGATGYTGRMDIVTLGELILDMFASEAGKDFRTVSAFLPVAGGAPAKFVAVAAAKLGKKAAFIGKVGEDAFGRGWNQS